MRSAGENNIAAGPVSSRPQDGCYRRQLFHEDFPGAAANVTIAGQICFGRYCFRIEQGADTLDGFEIQIGHAARLEPLLKGTALQRARVGTELFNRQIVALGFLRID
jgi:hypothetical protein